MDIQFHGANCITIATKRTRITIDDNLSELGGKSIEKADDIVLYTMAHGDPAHPPKIMIDTPGEYEVSGVAMYGIAARSNMDEPSKKTATMYKLVYDDTRMLITGHIFPELSDKQLETIGMIDIMFVPVGGNGYTMDSIGALKLIKKVEPKLVILTHYESEGLDYPVPQQPLSEALKTLGMEPKESITKFRVKPSEFGDTTQLVMLERA